MKFSRKQLSIILGICFFTSGVVAAMPPAPNYCEHMGYDYTHLENVSQSSGICHFNENESCEAGEFLEGECGQEHVKNISCRQRRSCFHGVRVMLRQHGAIYAARSDRSADLSTRKINLPENKHSGVFHHAGAGHPVRLSEDSFVKIPAQ